jgi:hypothetical protein
MNKPASLGMNKPASLGMNKPASLGMRTLLFLCIAANARAYTTGISGYSGKDGKLCTECHAAGAAAKPSATFKGPSFLAPGATAEYQLVVDTDVNSSASAQRAAGIDVATSDGTLATVNQVNQTRLIDNEISHTNALPQAKTIALSFSLTAPAQEGSLTLFGAALSADGNGQTGGDSVASTTLAVTITNTPPDLADVISGASPREEPASADLGPPRNEARWSCGSYAGSMALPVAATPLFGVLLLLLVLRRRV